MRASALPPLLAAGEALGPGLGCLAANCLQNNDIVVALGCLEELRWPRHPHEYAGRLRSGEHTNEQRVVVPQGRACVFRAGRFPNPADPPDAIGTLRR